jgi:hypothetical protein
VGRHPKSRNYRVTSKGKRIEIYAKMGPDAVDIYQEMLAAGLVPPGREQDMREIDERFAQFSPFLGFTLIGPERRTFSAEERSTWGGIDEWLELGQTGDIRPWRTRSCPRCMREHCRGTRRLSNRESPCGRPSRLAKDGER